jgi:hypothetical protein
MERGARLPERTGEVIAAAAERAIDRIGGFSYEQRVAFATDFGEETGVPPDVPIDVKRERWI